MSSSAKKVSCSENIANNAFARNDLGYPNESTSKGNRTYPTTPIVKRLRRGQHEVINLNPERSIRRTKSTSFPEKIRFWPMCKTVSTPNLKLYENDNENPSITPPARNKNDSRHRKTLNISEDFHRFLLIILNVTILIIGLLHFGAKIILFTYKDIILIITTISMFYILIATLAITSIALITLSIVSIYFVIRKSRNIIVHIIICSFTMAIVLISLPFYENLAEVKIIKEARQEMICSFHQNTASSRSALDYLQNTFKCCGVISSFDWCMTTCQEETPRNSRCDAPEFCSLHFGFLHFEKHSLNDTSNVLVSLTHNASCLFHIKNEIIYLGKMYRRVTYGTAVLVNNIPSLLA